MMDPLLTLLLDHRDYLSGEEIAQSFGISRAAVWKQIQKLENEGFKIESLHKKGYRLAAFPEGRIVPEAVVHYYGELLPFEINALRTIDSTNTYAKQSVTRGRKEPFVVTADLQSSGRGRLNREWKSPLGQDLLFTVAWYPDVPVQHFYRYTLLAALSLHEALSPLLGEKSQNLIIKWPNDLYYRDGKLAGILSEMIAEEQILKTILIGIGLNVNSESPVEGAESLRKIAGRPFERNILLAAILKKLAENYELLKKEGFEPIFRGWKSRMGWIGKPVRIVSGREDYRGILSDVTAEGIALVQTESGVREVVTGDILRIQD